MATKMIIDTANLLFRVAAVNRDKSFGTPEEQAGLALHVAFQSVFKYFKRFKPDEIAFTFEGKANWRKKYTASAVNKSGNQYKANRVKDASMEPYFALMDSFRDVMKAHSSAIILQRDELEGDDQFAAYTQVNTEAGHTVIGVSGDRDFVQLYKCPGFKLINPDTGKERNQPDDKEYYPDIDYFIFKKCVRGDMGDYVFSAFPRVRETRIVKAYQDELERVSFMKETWEIKDDDGNVIKTNVVGELFEENNLLMNLFAQPEEIRELMVESVRTATEEIGTYSNFHFLRFLGKHKLNNIADRIDQYTDMFVCNTRYRKKLAQIASGEIEDVPTPVPTTKKILLEF